MAKLEEIRVPDIGDFDDVDVAEVLVAVGDRVEVEQGLITLESDKASMEVPSPVAGTVKEIKVALGDQVGQDAVIAVVEIEGEAADSPATDSQPAVEAAPAPVSATSPPPIAAPVSATSPPPIAAPVPAAPPTPVAAPAAPPTPVAAPAAVAANTRDDVDHTCDIVVIGSGPGGYTAAFRAADLGLNTILVERDPYLGGVCLNVGCIPSKALLHAAKVIDEAAEFADHGIRFGAPEIDHDKLRSWKDDVVGRLTGGIATLAKQRKVKVVEGLGRFRDAHTLVATTPDGETTIGFDHAVIAVGSEPVRLPFLPDDPRIMDSTGALELPEPTGSLLCIGGGIIGLEMATVYSALGWRVSIVEMLDGLMPGVDRDLVRPFQKRMATKWDAVYTSTKVTAVEAGDDGLTVSFDGKDAPETATYDRILVAVGRVPNGKKIDAEAAGIAVDERGFIRVDKQQRTNVPHIFAIGDVVGQPMLAHKATHEG
ncbi:MAG: FAD-dependent oxidoreductase, partial [Acidobacteriota bacterium]